MSDINKELENLGIIHIHIFNFIKNNIIIFSIF